MLEKKKMYILLTFFCEFGTFSKSSIENQGQITLTFFFELKNFWTLKQLLKLTPTPKILFYNLIFVNIFAQLTKLSLTSKMIKQKNVQFFFL